VLHTTGPNFHLNDARLTKTSKPFGPTRSLGAAVDPLRTCCHKLASTRTYEFLVYQVISTCLRHFHSGRAHLGHISIRHIQKWPAQTNSRQTQ
jgi:hypothetical protein